MRYFKALEIATKPFIHWTLVAKNIEELEQFGLDDDPLVIAEDTIPGYIHNVCPLKIVEGELVERTAPEMEVFEAEFAITDRLITESLKVKLLDSLTFTYDSHIFPMNESARVLYHNFDKYRFGTIKRVMSTTGVYDLAVGDIDLFLEEYYKVVEGTLMP